jgi:hypothetical protein
MSNRKTQMLCAWCGPAAIVLFLLAFWPLAGLLLPVPSPSWSAAHIQHLYLTHTDSKRVGFMLFMVAGVLTGVWAAAIATQMKRIEGEHSPLTWTQLGMGMIGVLLFLFPGFFMQAAAFRPYRDPQLTLLINDVAWLPFIGAFGPAVIQCIAIGIACFKDTAERVFPRWLGYFNIWCALTFLPAALIYFFKNGAFAWNGVFCFWLPLTVFSTWFIVMFVMLRRAIIRQDEETAPVARAAAAEIPVPA